MYCILNRNNANTPTGKGQRDEKTQWAVSYLCCVGIFFLLYSFTIDISLRKCLKGFKIRAVYWDLLEYLWKPEFISNTLCPSRKTIPKFGLQMVILWIKLPWINESCIWPPGKFVDDHSEGSIACSKYIYGISSFFLPNFPSLCPSFHTNEYQGLSLKETNKKKKSQKSRISPNTGICVGGVDQTLPFCLGDSWKRIYELVVYVVDMFLGYNNVTKVKLYVVWLISNLDLPFQLSNRRSNLVQNDLTQNTT